MTVFIVEIDGRAVAAIEAPLQAEAEQHAQSVGFQTSLLILGHDGPLWDGRSEIHLRQATDKEEARWATVGPEKDQFIRAIVPIELGDDADRTGEGSSGAAKPQTLLRRLHVRLRSLWSR